MFAEILINILPENYNGMTNEINELKLVATDGSNFDVELKNTFRSQPLMLKLDPNVSIHDILDIKPKNNTLFWYRITNSYAVTKHINPIVTGVKPM